MILFFKRRGFTLIELLIAVVVIAIGMVFVLGALNQCVAVLTTSSKTIEANYLLNQKMWELDEIYYAGKTNDESGGNFSKPNADFSWILEDSDIAADFGNETRAVNEALISEATKVFWKQGKANKSVSITRFVKKKD